MALSFAVLGYYGYQLYVTAPPIPERVITPDGRVVLTGAQISEGQNVWQSIGGQELGTVWGHGSYVAPDWSADWLHRQSMFILDKWAQADHNQSFAQLPADQQALYQSRLATLTRKNTYDPATRTITIEPIMAESIAAVGAHYAGLFGSDPALDAERDAYAIPAATVKTPERQVALNAFFYWVAWACATNRPGDTITYTNNWPPEPAISNHPTGTLIIWSLVSFVLMLGGIGALVWYYSAAKREDECPTPVRDPLLGLTQTPSMTATLKYFWTVAALIVVQVFLGAITAHYGVEGQGFYGFPLAKWLPYSVTRTWHVQLGIFWIATAWLATGLFIAPAVAGREPPFQRFGVNVLYVCLLIIVIGSMFGQWLGVQQKLGNLQNFWFGHQGYEYVDLGRFWQWFLFIGLLLWFSLMVRAMWPAFRQPGEHKHLLALFTVASGAIGMFYGAGLMWGQHTNLAIVEYWRWWVVHLWVEGFFEVFATVVIAFLFTRMGLLRATTATAAVLFSTCVYLSGGIIGTFHHLYFTGTPTPVIALGASFSALEVVPLVLVGIEACENLRLSRASHWITGYRWPIYCFIAVAFWNLVGAGLFGFLINTPVALFYMQGLNTTPLHGHTALFGVYGMLGIGLMLFCLKAMAAQREWKTGVLSFSFWAINIGLALMALLSLLPVGIMQTVASINHGMWYARSMEFMQTPVMDKLRWLRVIGDTIFTFGIIGLGWFVLGLKLGWSTRKTGLIDSGHMSPVPAAE
jgi:nitric oxide reductase subunit B